MWSYIPAAISVCRQFLKLYSFIQKLTARTIRTSHIYYSTLSGPEASVDIATTSSVLPYKRRYTRRRQTPRHRPAQPIQAYIGRPPPPTPPPSKRSAVAASGATTDHYYNTVLHSTTAPPPLPPPPPPFSATEAPPAAAVQHETPAAAELDSELRTTTRLAGLSVLFR